MRLPLPQPQPLVAAFVQRCHSTTLLQRPPAAPSHDELNSPAPQTQPAAAQTAAPSPTAAVPSSLTYKSGDSNANSPFSLDVNAVVEAYNCRFQERSQARPEGRIGKMDFQCGCPDLSCTANLTISNVSKASSGTLEKFLLRKRLMYIRAYCAKKKEQGPHHNSFLVRMRRELDSDGDISYHVCPVGCCRARVPGWGPLGSNYGRSSIDQVLKVVICTCRGDTNKDIAAEADLSANTVSQMRQDFDYLLASVAWNRIEKAKGAVSVLQADEFAWGSPMYGYGHPTNKAGVIWFQSVVEILPNGRAGRFWIRPVANKNTQTLCTWIIHFAAKDCIVTTDQWAGYNALVTLAAAKGKTITHRRVNHSVSFLNAEGQHTNVVECMHARVRGVWDNMGKDFQCRLNRIMAASILAQPTRERAIVKFLRAIREIVDNGAPFDDLLEGNATREHYRWENRQAHILLEHEYLALSDDE